MNSYESGICNPAIIVPMKAHRLRIVLFYVVACYERKFQIASDQESLELSCGKRFRLQRAQSKRDCCYFRFCIRPREILEFTKWRLFQAM